VTTEDVDDLDEDQVRLLLKTLIERLHLAQEDGVFGNESWTGYLEIE
jgi:hypothetical protein